MSSAALLEIQKYEKDTEQCMKCGFCTYVCPVYREDKIESSVARGKNELIKRVLAGELELNRELADRLYKCTACMACTEACPAKAPIPRVVVAARADVARIIGMRFPYGFVSRRLLSNRKLFGNVLWLSSFVQSAFMPKTNGIIRHLPNFLSALSKGRQIPSIAPRFLRQQVPAVNKPAPGTKAVLRVGYFTGCMNEYVLPHLGRKTVDFLTRRGVEVVMPERQGCCGAAVYLGAGDFETGRKIADANVEAFQGLDYIITDCATCACTLREYQRFLADTPERKESYSGFAAKVKHLSNFVVDVLQIQASRFQGSAALKGKKITWHDPCHLSRHLGIRQQPRQILRSLPDVQYVEMPNADRCCGMAGQFGLMYYDLSKKIAEKKIQSIDAVDADVVVTACPGCEFQLLDNLTRLHKRQKVMSLVELLQ
jgi:glycolate oxidase iron-sulfur subunit